MKWTLSVSELNEYVRLSLAGDPMLRDLTLSGEISGFKRQVSGHWYFTLKDEKSRISCVFFRQNALGCDFVPRDGDRVVLTGSVGLYTVQGSYQFYTETMKKDGQGELYLRFEALKKKLAAEGLFDQARKRVLPLRPRTVAVVTSRSGAVIHDIARVAGRRDPSVQLVLRPALVQGEGAAEDIARGIREAALLSGADVLIIGRGGGSMEDLWAFNEEIVVRAIAACPIPVISAVGHEVDVTLSDFAADVRAATPSAAAEIAVPDRKKLREETEGLLSRLNGAMESVLLRNRNALHLIEKRLSARHPAQRLAQLRNCREICALRLNKAMEEKLRGLRAGAELLGNRLEALGPRKILQRGYTIVTEGGRPVSSVKNLGESARVTFQDGHAQVQVTQIREGDPFASEEKGERDV